MSDVEAHAANCRMAKIVPLEALPFKGFPIGYSERVCVSAWRTCFPKRRLTNTRRRHRLADGHLSSLYPPSPSFSLFGAASVMLGFSPPASSSTPLRPSVYYRIISLVINIIYIRTLCDLLYVLYILDPTCILLWSQARFDSPSLGQTVLIFRVSVVVLIGIEHVMCGRTTPQH